MLPIVILLIYLLGLVCFSVLAKIEADRRWGGLGNLEDVGMVGVGALVWPVIFFLVCVGGCGWVLVKAVRKLGVRI